MLSDKEKRTLSKVRLEHAQDFLIEAESLLSIEQYRGASNLLLTVFHAIRAVLALDGIDRKSHSGAISEFRRLYIKTGIFDAAWSDMIGDQFDFRTANDYNDFFTPTREETVEQVANAKRFLTLIADYLENI